MKIKEGIVMANNLFISYDLNSPGQDYEKVINAIKALGNWASVQKSLWYVNSSYSAEQAGNIIWRQMDNNDYLIVIDTSNNDAFGFNIENKVLNHMQKNWLI